MANSLALVAGRRARARFALEACSLAVESAQWVASSPMLLSLVLGSLLLTLFLCLKHGKGAQKAPTTYKNKKVQAQTTYKYKHVAPRFQTLLLTLLPLLCC